MEPLPNWSVTTNRAPLRVFSPIAISRFMFLLGGGLAGPHTGRLEGVTGDDLKANLWALRRLQQTGQNLQRRQAGGRDDT